MAVSFVFWLSSMSTLVNAWRFYPPPGPFELKVSYVARLFTCRFQVFPFYGDSSLRLECGAASVCNDAVDNGLCLSPGRHFRTRSSRRFSSWLATPSVEPHETRTGCERGGVKGEWSMTEFPVAFAILFLAGCFSSNNPPGNSLYPCSLFVHNRVIFSGER